MCDGGCILEFARYEKQKFASQSEMHATYDDDDETQFSNNANFTPLLHFASSCVAKKTIGLCASKK